MARLIALKQTAPERFLARFDTGEELRTTLAVVTDFHLRSGKELTSPELDALRAASERSRCRQRALRIIGTRAMSVRELTDRLKEKGETPDNAEDAAAWLEQMHLLDLLVLIFNGQLLRSLNRFQRLLRILLCIHRFHSF